MTKVQPNGHQFRAFRCLLAISFVLLAPAHQGCAVLFRGGGKQKWVPLTSDPMGARVFLDGKLLGVTPTAVNAGRGGALQQVTLTSDPWGAQVSLDGVFSGVTPMTLDIGPDTEIVYRMAGYQDRIVPVSTKFDWWWILIDLLWGPAAPIAWFFDGISGAWMSAEPQDVNARMVPLTGGWAEAPGFGAQSNYGPQPGSSN